MKTYSKYEKAQQIRRAKLTTNLINNGKELSITTTYIQKINNGRKQFNKKNGKIQPKQKGYSQRQAFHCGRYMLARHAQRAQVSTCRAPAFPRMPHGTPRLVFKPFWPSFAGVFSPSHWFFLLLFSSYSLVVLWEKKVAFFDPYSSKFGAPRSIHLLSL